jgi:hypothetical protein
MTEEKCQNSVFDMIISSFTVYLGETMGMTKCVFMLSRINEVARLVEVASNLHSANLIQVDVVA